MTSNVCRVKLTAGNIRNHHFYMRGCDSVIPPGGVGGKNKGHPGSSFSVRFEPGPTIETDVDGDKMILRNRKAVRAFLEASAAVEGDQVAIERSADRILTVWLERASDT